MHFSVCVGACARMHSFVCVCVLPWKQMFVSNDKWNKSRARWCFTFCMMLALLVCPRHSALQYSRMSCFGPIFRDPVKYNMPSVKLISIKIRQVLSLKQLKPFPLNLQKIHVILACKLIYKWTKKGHLDW